MAHAIKYTPGDPQSPPVKSKDQTEDHPGPSEVAIKLDSDKSEKEQQVRLKILFFFYVRMTLFYFRKISLSA